MAPLLKWKRACSCRDCSGLKPPGAVILRGGVMVGIECKACGERVLFRNALKVAA